jgi:Flp pilus assembly protein TadD/type II secretory pathway pseudopilin PulG
MTDHAFPPALRVFAYADSILGVITVVIAMALGSSISAMQHLSRNQSTVLGLLAAYGVANLVASHGLLRVQDYGASFQRMTSVGWLAASVVVIALNARDGDLGITVLMMVPGAMLAVASLFYFRRPDVQALFEAPPPPSPWHARSVLIADGVLILFLLGFVYPKVRSMSGRSPLKRTMADMRTIATAAEAYATDHNDYPDVRSIEELDAALTPTYIRQLRRVDGWGNPFRYEAWREATDAQPGPQHYAVGSSGIDGRFDLPSLRSYKPGTTHDDKADIVYSKGSFVICPEGMQEEWREASAQWPGETSTVTDTATAFEKGTSLYHDGRAAEAIPLLEQVVRTNPDQALAQARLGGAYANVERYQDAIPHLQRAIALDATDYQSRSNLGVAYEKLGHPELGIEPARQAVVVQPQNAVVLSNLGWVLLRAKRPAEAVDAYLKSVAVDPHNAQTHYFLGQAYLEAGRRDKARSEALLLRQLDPNLSRQLDASISKNGR